MKHRNTVEFQISGDYALFSDPVMRVGGEKMCIRDSLYVFGLKDLRKG